MVNDKDFDTYYSMLCKAKELEKLNKIDDAISIYMDILSNYKPIGYTYYERPAILLEKKKDYKSALDVCNIALSNKVVFNTQTWSKIYTEFTKRKNRLINKMENPPNTTTSKPRKPQPKIEASSKEVATINLNKDIIYPDWYISISFGKSTSNSFPQALALAKASPQYIENNVEGKILYQAIYSNKPNEYLQFIKLYELISGWKSCFVVINGNLTDRKIVGGLNYCYGDKCRSGNSKFCFGASEMTTNPFGCHRLQISASNNPWWRYSIRTQASFKIKKDEIIARINEKSLPYQACPDFNMNQIMDAVKSLPNSLSIKEYQDLEESCYCVGGLTITVSNTNTFNSTNSVNPDSTNTIYPTYSSPKMTLDELLAQRRNNNSEPESKTLFNKLISFFKK